jgi:hypothetical protein
MAKVQIYICDSIHCEEKSEHVLAIIRNDESIREQDITCTDSITKFYDSKWCGYGENPLAENW